METLKSTIMEPFLEGFRITILEEGLDEATQ